MIDRFLSLLSQGREAPLRVAPSHPVSELRAHFARHGRLEIPNALPRASADAIARAAARRRFSRRAPSPSELENGTSSHMFYEDPIVPHRACVRRCRPICMFGRSAIEGDLLAFARAVSDRPRLVTKSLSARSYVKGSHVDPGFDERPGIELIWCATRDWKPEDGGEFRFGDVELVPPSFGALHVVDRRSHDGFAIALVKRHGPLTTLSVWMEDESNAG